jgi:Spy/CpxP family protein refolding chaperone
MRTVGRVAIVACLALAGLLASYSAAARAQESAKDAMVTFAFDLHEGVKRSSLTPQQKEQVRNDLKTLRQAHQSGDRRTAFRAMMNFHRLLDSGAFQPRDQQRIKQDLQNLREAKQQSGGGGMGMGPGMGGMR